MGKLLLVAYPFPPEGGKGVKRTLKFIKFLPALGWEPFILTVKNGNYDAHDSSLLNEVEKRVTVYRAHTLEAPFSINLRDCLVAKDVHAERYSILTTCAIRKKFRSIYHLLGVLLGIPDAHIMWLPFAFLKGIKIIKKHSIDVIYATGPTFTDHLVGMLLKIIMKKPLVVDYRDAWMADPAREWPNKIRKKAEQYMEKKVIRWSDIVVSTTDGITESFKERYYNEDKGKFVTITNGYDIDDFNEMATVCSKNDKKFQIVHTGTLFRERSPKYFLQAVRLLLDEHPELGNKVEVYFVGQDTKFANDECIEDYITGFSLKNVVKLTGFVSRKESIAYQFSADLLLLIIGIVPDQSIKSYGLSGKVFDYAMIHKPVLALAQEGASAKFIRTINIGTVVNPEDINQIKNVLYQSYQKYKSNQLTINPNVEELEKYDFRYLTRRLSESLDRLP